MFVSRGLVGPKLYHNLNTATGKQVNIPVPCVDILTHRVTHSGTVVPSNRISSWSTIMVRIERNRNGVSMFIPGAREKVTH